MPCHALSICFEETDLPLQVPIIQGKLLLIIHVRQPWKNLQVAIVIGEVKIEELSLGSLKIKIFQGPPPREN